MIWNLICYSINGVYAYQAVQSLIPVWADFLFYAVAIFTIVGCYYLTRWLTFKRWGAQLGRHSTATDGDTDESDVDSLLSDTANSTFDPFEPPPALLPLSTTSMVGSLGSTHSLESSSGSGSAVPSPASASSASAFGWNANANTNNTPNSNSNPSTARTHKTHRRNRSNQHHQHSSYAHASNSNSTSNTVYSAYSYENMHGDDDVDVNLTVDAVSLQPYADRDSVSLSATVGNGSSVSNHDIVEKDHVWHA